MAILERFLKVRDTKGGVPDFWESALGVHPDRVVDHMLKLGLLEPISLTEKIEFCFTVAELRKMLASHGLKVSGKKAELVQRLIEADPDGLRKQCSHRTLARCTKSVSETVSVWRARQSESLERANDEVIAALRSRLFKTAINIADAYRKNSFHPPIHPAQEAMTIKPAPRSLDVRVKELAGFFKMRPKILRGLSSSQWEGLHLSYAVWQLLGRAAQDKCMPGFTGIGAMDSATVLRMLSFHIGRQRDLAQWRRLDIKKATIKCCNSGSCETCIGLDGKTYRLDDLPEIPHKDCTSALGCRCYVSPEISF